MSLISEKRQTLLIVMFAHSKLFKSSIFLFYLPFEMCGENELLILVGNDYFLNTIYFFSLFLTSFLKYKLF